MPMNVGPKNENQDSARAAGGNVDADAVVRGLAKYANAAKGPFDLNKPYGGETAVASSWRHKDAAGLAVWANAGAMGPAFQWAAKMNSGDGGDYLGRALSSNADGGLWLRALVDAGVVKAPRPEWRAAIELATLTLDIGDDGAGRTGYSYVLTGVDGYPTDDKAPSVKLPTGLHARAAALVGGSGQGGLYAETVYDATDIAKSFTKRLVSDERKEIEGLVSKAVDPGQVKREIGMLEDGSLVSNKADREAFADALVIVKMSDRSRGKALSTYTDAGGGAAGITALQESDDYRKIVANYEKHKTVRKD